ncbi:hypothetical protein Bca101_006059 [Brassica carinata]
MIRCNVDVKFTFRRDDKEPVSFVCLPIQWNDKEKVDGSAAGLYLRGTFDDGWRFLSSINQLHFRPLLLVAPLNWQTDE